MESLPQLPGSPQLRAFVIWATAGLLGILVGMGAAAARKRWAEVRRAALPLGVVLLGALIGQLAPSTHLWVMWVAVVLGAWAAFKNTGLSSFATFFGAIGLGAASILAQSLF